MTDVAPVITETKPVTCASEHVMTDGRSVMMGVESPYPP